MSANPIPSPAMVRKVVIASILGNAFEWFDFAIYGLFAVTIARLYFPADNALASLMLTLATFGIGFAVRPCCWGYMETVSAARRHSRSPLC
jgi:MHS family proline/betaine transporter-like MFS transporter